MSIPALFIGGPMNGKRRMLERLNRYVQFPVMNDVKWVAWTSSPEDTVQWKTLTYELYDDWPVKYVWDGKEAS